MIDLGRELYCRRLEWIRIGQGDRQLECTCHTWVEHGACILCAVGHVYHRRTATRSGPAAPPPSGGCPPSAARESAGSDPVHARNFTGFEPVGSYWYRHQPRIVRQNAQRAARNTHNTQRCMKRCFRSGTISRIHHLQQVGKLLVCTLDSSHGWVKFEMPLLR